MPNLFVEETWIDKTRDLCVSKSGVYETAYDTPGALYRALRAEYGRCIGHVYVDTKDGATRSIGWVFVKRAKYEDTDETYLQETWATLHDAQPDRTVTCHYHAL